VGIDEKSMGNGKRGKWKSTKKEGNRIRRREGVGMGAE